jgi:hypothetical protein
VQEQQRLAFAHAPDIDLAAPHGDQRVLRHVCLAPSWWGRFLNPPPANGNGGPYNPTTGWRINSIGVSFDNETRRWCMRTHIYIPDVGNCICL